MPEVFPRLFSPTKLAGYTLNNRIAMAPLTRQMAEPDGTPTDEMAAYYARRARGGCGLIITEGTYEEDRSGCRAYLSQPGIANARHVAGWRKVTDAVHKHGAVIILQLMHGGRVTDPRCLAQGEQPVSASATRSEGWTLYTDTDDEKMIRNIEGDWPKVTFGPARALTISEIHQVADGFAAGARRAMEAGFDGVEIHGANGYLLYQFIHPKTNLRTDEFGGSPENNIRIATLTCEAVRKAIGPGKIISLRLSQDGVDDFAGAWPGGVAYARQIGKALKDSAVDALHWSSFNYLEKSRPELDDPDARRAARGLGTPVDYQRRHRRRPAGRDGADQRRGGHRRGWTADFRSTRLAVHRAFGGPLSLGGLRPEIRCSAAAGLWARISDGDQRSELGDQLVNGRRPGKRNVSARADGTGDVKRSVPELLAPALVHERRSNG